jgi:hypothetical protein
MHDIKHNRTTITRLGIPEYLLNDNKFGRYSDAIWRVRKMQHSLKAVNLSVQYFKKTERLKASAISTTSVKNIQELVNFQKTIYKMWLCLTEAEPARSHTT